MAHAEPTPGSRYVPLLHLLRTAESIWNASRVFFVQWDLSPSQFNILNLLRRQGQGLTQVELSRELIMHRSNVTGLIDRLEKRNLVMRKPMVEDRRVWRICLTPNGRKLIARILPNYYQLIEELWGKIPPDKALRLARELEHLREQADLLASRFQEVNKT